MMSIQISVYKPPRNYIKNIVLFRVFLILRKKIEHRLGQLLCFN